MDQIIRAAGQEREQLQDYKVCPGPLCCGGKDASNGWRGREQGFGLKLLQMTEQKARS